MHDDDGEVVDDDGGDYGDDNGDGYDALCPGTRSPAAWRSPPMARHL